MICSTLVSFMGRVFAKKLDLPAGRTPKRKSRRRILKVNM